LPSIVEREVAEVMRRVFREAREKVEGSMQTIRAIAGKSAEVPLPSAAEIDVAVASRIEEFGPLIERLDPPHNLWEAALDRVIKRLPPNQGREEQFRDSLIWETAVDRATEEEVVLISNDKAFYDASRGDQLHGDLAAELNGLGLGSRVSAYRSIDSFLRAAGEALLTFDLPAVIAAVDIICREHAADGPADLGYEPRELALPLVRVFATERPGTLAVAFDMRYAVDDVPLLSGDILPRALLSIKGTGEVSTETWVPTNVQWGSEQIVNDRGERLPARGNVYANAHIALGTKYVPYEVRYELSPPAA
jgi:hypothetical protein